MNKMTAVTPVRDTPEHKALHQKKADLANISLSEFYRQAGDKAEIIIKNNSFILKLIEEEHAKGNNLNQMAKAANAANLSGKVSDKIYQEFIHRLKIYTDELKAYNKLIRMKADL